MSGKTRDWLKFGTLVALAFALGLAFASAGDGTITVIREDSADKFSAIQTVLSFPPGTPSDADAFATTMLFRNGLIT